MRKVPKKGTSVGSGGQRRRQLEGRGPTPPAEQRGHHPAARRADAAARTAQGAGGRRGGASRPSAAGRSSGSGRPATGRASGAGRAPAPRRGNRDSVEIVAGRNAVLEALSAGLVPDTVYVAERLETDDRVRAILKVCTARGLPVLEAPRAELDRLTGDAVHQGVALAVQPYAYLEPGELRARATAAATATAGTTPVVVALDGVLDPHNLGAVARSAAAFGAVGLLLPERRSAGVTAGAWKASAGALARLPVARATNLTRALGDFADEGWTILGLAGEAGNVIADLATVLPGALDGPLVLVAGAEAKGLARLTRERCDVLVGVPIDAATESLNVSVATAIALYELRRLRA